MRFPNGMLAIYNPQVDDFLGSPPHFGILRRRPLKKYGFLLEQAKKEQCQLAFVVDATTSAFIPNTVFSRLPKLLRKFISEAEFRRWLRLNEVDRCSVTRLQCSDECGKYVLLAFSYKAATEGFHLRRPTFEKFGAVVFHLSHYFVSTRLKAANLRAMDNVFLAGDSDLSANPFFRTFFDWYRKPFLVLPFAVGPRFQAVTPFHERIHRCIATGSFHDLTQERPAHKYKDFIDSTGVDTYHPIRKSIYLSRAQLADWVYCLVAPYRDYASRGTLYRLVSHVNVSQKKYFSVNIVDAYNSSKFAVVGEEISGFPALGALEAMACGCVLLGQAPYYAGLPLRADIHYVEYDGSLQGLKRAMSRLSADEQETVAAAGRRAASEHFQPRQVFLIWKKTLATLLPDRERAMVN